MLFVRQIKIDALNYNDEAITAAICKKLKCTSKDIINYKLKKRSIDARDKSRVYYVLELLVNACDESQILKRSQCADVSCFESNTYRLHNFGMEILDARPVIVGSGPAGLFAGYLLAQYGYKPIILERGEDVDNRLKSVENFWKTGKLNINSNVQFGEGGAGTFSDGKLSTQVNDKENRIRFILETFVKHGAPEDILYDSKPHIGTNKLVDMLKLMREKIIKLGGEFHINSLVTNLIINNNKLEAIEVNNKEIIKCNVCVLAIGHSSRDTFRMLNTNKVQMKNKPFAVGVRIMHNQKDIDLSQYGKKYKDILPSASYKLIYKASNNRGVYSFCMCPGGYVVNASSEEKSLAVNGMSNYERDSTVANSAIIVTVDEKDYGTELFAGVKYQEVLERRAYEVGRGRIPVQLLGDFNENVVSQKFGSVIPKIKGAFELANLNDVLPKEICNSLKESFGIFGKKINGFDDPDSVLAGIESRTSSPITIMRDNKLESNIKGVYPCGEGAGYAGGIISAAIDGMKVSEEIIKKYMPIDKKNVN